MLEKFKLLQWFKVFENESIFQKYKHFFARKSIFSKEKIKKADIILKNFWVSFGKIYRILIFMEELYKSRKIPRWIILSSWEIYQKAKNGYHAPTAGGPGDEGPPRTVVKFNFYKWFKVLENESIFQKEQFFWPEKFIFS